MLPLVYRNLKAHRIEDPLSDKLKGVYRHTWYKNQVFLRRMAELLRFFHAAGIETLILKGAPLALRYYRDPGLRPMVDFDVMVPSRQALAAIDLLRRHGWIRCEKWPETFHESYISVGHAVGFRDREGSQCDLHWHLLPECCRAASDEEFWNAALPVKIHDVTTLTLNASDHLLHVCAHGLRWDPLPPFRWVADAMAIINSEPRLDWNRLLAQAEKHRLVWPLREALFYLREKFDAPVPDAVLHGMRNIPTSKIERVEYRYKTQNHECNPLGYLPIHWFNFMRLEDGGGSKYNPIAFAKYLQRLCGVNSVLELVAYAVMRRARRMWKDQAKVPIQAP